MAESIKNLFQEIWFFPRIRSGALRVWSHNFLVFRQAVLTNFFWVGVEPIIYLFAIGIGIGSLVNEVNGVSYFEFFFPGLLAICAMISTSYEITHGTYNRAHLSKTFSILYLTPISSIDLFMGELIWAVFKGMISVTTVLLVLLIGSHINVTEFVSLFFSSLFICWFFAGLGLFYTSVAKSSESFILYQAGFLVPMAMLCGTYFPLENYPFAVQSLIKGLPLTQAVFVFRSISHGSYEVSLYASAVYFIVFGLFFTNWALTRMTRKLETVL